MGLERLRRWALAVGSAAFLFQVGGCNTNTTLEFLQTAFLGVTAVASYAILRNI